MSSVDKIKWAMSLRDPQYEALQFFDAISSKIEYRTSSKAEAEKIASENCQAPHLMYILQSQEMQYQFHLGQILLMISWGHKEQLSKH